MLTDYIKAAMRRAKYEILGDDELYYGEIPDLPGIFGCAKTRQACVDDLRDAVTDWIALALEENLPLTAINGITISSGVKEIEKFLETHTYSHDFMSKGNKHFQLPNLDEIPGTLIEKIIRNAGITEEEWEAVK